MCVWGGGGGGGGDVLTSPSNSLINHDNLMSILGHMSGLSVVLTSETHLFESISPAEDGPAPNAV